MKFVLSYKYRFIVFIIILVILFCYFLVVPHIILKGKKQVIVEYGNTYEEEGFKVFTIFKHVDNLKITSNINYKKTGKYEIKYELSFLGFKIKKIRIINIVDREKPVINLKGNNPSVVCPNKHYEEEGYEALDNYDGDLSDEIERVDNHNNILYTVKDSSNNMTVIERNIIYEDKEAPVIELNGGDKTIYLGNIYHDDGFKALDNCDGDITSKVEVSNNINNNKIGEYEVTYKVTDSSNNITEVKRKVNVISPPDKGQAGVIYLTFDDGPSASITPKLLDILKQEGVVATFFVINHNNSLNYLIKRENDEGHAVGLHSYTHNYKQVYASEQAYFNDLNAISNKVEKIIGYKTKIIRFPGGGSNTVSRFNPGIMSRLSVEVHNKGYKYYDWNVSSGDAGGAKNSNDVYKNVISGLSKNKANIVLLHDFENNTKTLNALKDIIRYGKNNGYRFEKITFSTAEVHHSINN